MPATPLGDGVGASCTGLARAGSRPGPGVARPRRVEQAALRLVPVVGPDPVHQPFRPGEPFDLAGGLVGVQRRGRDLDLVVQQPGHAAGRVGHGVLGRRARGAGAPA